MKKLLALALSAAIIVSLFAACSKPQEEETTTKAPETTATATQTTAQPTTAQTTTEAETKKKEKPFDKWNIRDLANYFKSENIFTEEDWLGVYDYFEELPDGVSGEIEYNNHENDKVNVLIFFLDENSDNEKTKEIYEKTKTDKYFEWENGGRQQPFNALVGRFAIFYSASVDENFVKKFEKALDKLIKKEKLTPEFYEKNLDLSKYKADDDVIIIEADD